MGTLLLLNKLSIGRKVISLAVNWVGLAGSALLKLLTGGRIDLAGKFGGSGMQRAADTMIVAAGRMQVAADTMAGSGGKIGAGLASGEAAAEGAAATSFSSVFAAAMPLAAVAFAGIVAAHLDPSHRRPQSPKEQLATTPAGRRANLGGPSGLPTAGHVPSGAGTGPQGASAQQAFGQSQYAKADLLWLAKYYGISLPQAIKLSRDAQLDLGKESTKTPAELGPVIAKVAQYFKDVSATSDPVQRATKAQAAYTLSARSLTAAYVAGRAPQRTFTSLLVSAGANSKKAASLVDQYTIAVQDNGTKSAAAQHVRAQMVSDFEHAGLNAKQAGGLVDQLTRGIDRNGNTAADKRAARKALIQDLRLPG